MNNPEPKKIENDIQHEKQKNMEGRKTQNNEYDLGKLLSLYKHLDTSLSTKENLFIPISFTPMVLVISNWTDLNWILVSLAWLVSAIIYFFFWRISVRLGGFQDRIFNLIYEKQGGRDNSEHLDIVDYYPEYGPKSITSIRSLRKLLFFVLNLIWIIILVLKFFMPEAMKIK